MSVKTKEGWSQVCLPMAENGPPVVYKGRDSQSDAAVTGAESDSTEDAWLEPLLAYGKTSQRTYTITRSDKVLKLSWPGVQVTPSQLAELLKTLPSGKRLDGATRFGTRVATFSYDGKLRKGRLAPPGQDGVVLVWTEPQVDLTELEEKARPTFEPTGECLGRLVLETSSHRAVARIYRDPEQQSPGFVLLRQGEVVKDKDWLDTLDHPEEARLCQVVIDGDLPWEDGVPSVFKGRFRKLARLAAQKSKELLQTLPAPSENRALIPSLLESPAFLTRCESLAGQLPPVATIGQILELLQNAGGNQRIAALEEVMVIPPSRFEEILAQTDRLLSKDGQFCLSRSLDGAWLMLHQDVLIRLFSLNPEARASDGYVKANSLDGQEREIDIPIPVEPKERRALEALLRYGRMSERELASTVGTRRVAGLLEKLISRLESAGCYLLSVAGESDDGRIYELKSA